MVRLDVFDRDSSSENLSKHDYVGSSTFTLGKLMSSAGQTLNMVLLNKSNRKVGEVTVVGEEAAHCADVLVITFQAKNLDNKDGFFGKSDP